MKLNVKMYCPGMLIQMDGLPMEFPNHSVVDDVLNECLTIPGVTEEIRDGSFMLDHQVVTRNTPLLNGKELLIMRVLEGG